VEVLRPSTLPTSVYVLLRYALAPYALGAKAWSTGAKYFHGGPPVHRRHAGADEESLARYLLTPGLPPRHQRFDS
jgi:hypothetical protein